MTDRSLVARSQSQGGRLARSRQFSWVAGAGFVARGVVYALMGLLALGLALGVGGKTTSQQGALRTIGQQPLGEGMLIAIAAGLRSEERRVGEEGRSRGGADH